MTKRNHSYSSDPRSLSIQHFAKLYHITISSAMIPSDYYLRKLSHRRTKRVPGNNPIDPRFRHEGSRKYHWRLILPISSGIYCPPSHDTHAPGQSTSIGFARGLMRRRSLREHNKELQEQDCYPIATRAVRSFSEWFCMVLKDIQPEIAGFKHEKTSPTLPQVRQVRQKHSFANFQFEKDIDRYPLSTPSKHRISQRS